VSGGIEGGSADSLQGVVETLEIYGVRGVLQTANKVCVMEGPCSGAHSPLLEFLRLSPFSSGPSTTTCSSTHLCHLLVSLEHVAVGRFPILEVRTNRWHPEPLPAYPTPHPSDHLPLQGSGQLHQLREQRHSYLNPFLEPIGTSLSSSPKPLPNPDPGSSPPCQQPSTLLKCMKRQ
jgi:hypothetical protein